jgi:hypothetical protein
MRPLIAFLLCFFVAFQSMANAHVLQQPCPMDQSQDVSVAADGDGCCNDADTVAKTGKLCKTDVPCGSLGACVLPSFRVWLPATPASDPLPAKQTQHSSIDPSGVWRPPTLS